MWIVLRKAPPLSFLTERVHGRKMTVPALIHADDPKQREPLVEPSRDFRSNARPTS
jgi:hypothetical protein